MTAVVRNLAKLPESDRQAIAVYLKSLPPLVRLGQTVRRSARRSPSSAKLRSSMLYRAERCAATLGLMRPGPSR